MTTAVARSGMYLGFRRIMPGCGEKTVRQSRAQRLEDSPQRPPNISKPCPEQFALEQANRDDDQRFGYRRDVGADISGIQRRGERLDKQSTDHGADQVETTSLQ